MYFSGCEAQSPKFPGSMEAQSPKYPESSGGQSPEYYGPMNGQSPHYSETKSPQQTMDSLLYQNKVKLTNFASCTFCNKNYI